ncbi:MAG: hypothetical protein SF069_04415 [Phycisphaerae bacterium]|nr:hypothetical protein [Phycisphaerae bacterium]
MTTFRVALFAAVLCAAPNALSAAEYRVACSLADSPSSGEVIGFDVEAADGHGLASDVTGANRQRWPKRLVTQLMVTPAQLHLVVANRFGEAVLMLSADATALPTGAAPTPPPVTPVAARRRDGDPSPHVLGVAYAGRLDQETGNEAAFDARAVTCGIRTIP